MSDLPASLPHEESVANDLISDEYVHEPSAVDSSTVSALVSATPKPKRSPQTQQLPQTLPYSLTIESQDMKLTGGFHLQNEAGQPDGIAFIKTPVVKVTGEFASVPPGIYWPLYKVKWDPEASSLEHVLFSAMVVKSNLDLLLYATDGSTLEQNDTSQFILGPNFRTSASDEWIELKGREFTVTVPSQVMVSIEEVSTDVEKSGLFVHSFTLIQKEPLDTLDSVAAALLEAHLPGMGLPTTGSTNARRASSSRKRKSTRSVKDEDDEDDPDYGLGRNGKPRPICDVCNKSFSRNQDLTRHMQTHNRTVSFNCEVCNKQFSRKDALKRHLRTSKPCENGSMRD